MIISTIFQKVFIPFNLGCGFHSQQLFRKDKRLLWIYDSELQKNYDLPTTSANPPVTPVKHPKSDYKT